MSLKFLAMAAALGCMTGATVAASQASADVVDFAGFSSTRPTTGGTDSWGNSWKYTPTSRTVTYTGTYKGTDGLGDTYDGDDFGLSFVITNPVSSGFGFVSETAIVNGVAWIPSTFGTDVTFDAPLGVTVSPGELFDIVVKYKGGVTDAGTTATWSATVPEPATWAMLGIGFAGIGLVGMTKRRKVSRYAL